MILRWLCLASLCLIDALGLEELYLLYHDMVAEAPDTDDDFPDSRSHAAVNTAEPGVPRASHAEK